MPQNDFWKSKLAAYLHDPPSKCVDIRQHEDHARLLFRQAGFTDEEEIRRLGDAYAKPSDWAASAADRFPFPKSRGNVSSAFDGVRARFHHPLSSGLELAFHKEFSSAEMAMEVDQDLQPIVADAPDASEATKWRDRFFAHWRLWEKFTAEHDYRFASLPAETRLPDHSVWTHMQLVSALDGCSDAPGFKATLKPAFLKFQIGPVQEFIAESRSVRDLWSGSYLLSWLMAAGLKSLTMEVGPDAVIYPNLKGQPLLDLHLRDEVWKSIIVNGKSVWDHLKHSKTSLLTPNLPNVFLAVVHQDKAEALASTIESAIRTEWKNIANSVWESCEKAGLTGDEGDLGENERKDRFFSQAEKFLTVSWQATPWPEDLDAAIELAEGFADGMPIREAAERVRAVCDYATKTMPATDRDSRYYQTNGQLNNIGLGWSVMLAFNSWQLDAVRQTRAFDAWADDGGWKSGTHQNKDSLGGKAEAVAGGHVWKERAAKKGGPWEKLFKHDDWLGAATLIKRVWHLAHLCEAPWGLPADASGFPMPNTHKIAVGKPHESGDDEDIEKAPGEGYFAVLALDGDQIGKWISGENTPKMRSQLSSYTDANGKQAQGALDYFEKHGGAALLDTSRPLSPSYHLQFSEALSNFALKCARPVVEAHHGRLIYAGGDDVLAMLPANTALACARDLREAFQGRAVAQAGITSPAPGFLSMANDQFGHPIPFIVPGPAAEVSVGIAVAHFKSPLQDVVRAAQAAEKRAKRGPGDGGLGRAAVAMTLLKRSGEITEWGAQWNSGGLELYQAIADGLEGGSLTAKFPHRICELLAPYLPSQTGVGHLDDASSFDAAAVIVEEFRFAVGRQSEPRKAGENERSLVPLLTCYLANIKPAQPQSLVRALDGLCTAVAFAHRTRKNP